MRRLIFVVPGLVGSPEHPSALDQDLPALAEAAAGARLVRIAGEQGPGLAEAAYLGLEPSRVSPAQGPLTVAALGADPPERSVQFHLSLMSLGPDGRLSARPHRPTEEEERRLTALLEKLGSRTLTVVPGIGLDHGLVWEKGSLDLACTSETEAHGRVWSEVLPEGDGERLLRRLIDDSVNLLDEDELNQRRRDEDRLPLNILWPWGPGFRPELPNLTWERGEPLWVEAGSLRVRGLARLAGARIGDRSPFGPGLNIAFRALTERALSRDASVTVIEETARFRRPDRIEEIAWAACEIEEHVVRPILRAAERQALRWALLSPRPDGDGLGMIYDSERLMVHSFPFHEKVLDDERLPRLTLAEAVREALRWDGSREGS